ncbi:hypothetical protein [Streptomyces sp. 35G-GA-8]|uniref:hypothetical protein n=1 Tax=Streptomyces sp. 35G-GA-8 TaxID=2939434 RepID=UPI00201FA6C2|nr:hypothetical protein [Streptomyces sp. 35G-GA-8]MCL7382233.1 hypothetical protein [Streptomyces sp. 35G-GA-8]
MRIAHTRKPRTLVIAVVAAGLAAGGITAATSDLSPGGTRPSTDQIANAAAADTGGLPRVKGLKFTLGDRSVKLSWKKVRGADGYRVYADYSCSNIPTSTSTYQLIEEHLGQRSEWTHRAITATCVNYAVAAVRDGKQGALPPLGKRVVISTANRDHANATKKFFTAAPDAGDTVGRTRVAPGPDRGIVLARAYIRNKDTFTESIGDHRGWTANPAASSKVTVAWNTGTGEIAAYVHKSCLAGARLPNGESVEAGCFNALPAAFVSHAASVGDASTDQRNLISVSRTDSGGLSIGVSAVNSISSTLGRINGQLTLSPHKDTFRVTLTADRFPAWEFIRYPHFVQGAPIGEAKVIGTRDQTTIGDLTSGRQSTCTSTGAETLDFENPMSC